ncbi:MAG: ABC transporter permease [Acidobacteria bacterium]|nr:ABC transporter permease [Acidobacteriota bacterium]
MARAGAGARPRSAAARSDRRGRPSRLAESDSRDARGFLHRPGPEEPALANGRGAEGGLVNIRVIGHIAVNVFKESVRDKVLYNLVFFAVMLMAVSFLLGQLTAGQDIKIIKDLGLAAMSIFGLFIAVFIGIGLVSKEVERRSIYSMLSKPIRRQEFIVGKYAGLVLTLVVNIAIMTAAYYAVLGYMAWKAGGWFMPGWEAPALDPRLLKAILMIFVQLAMVTALALLFSTFSSPMLAAALTFGLYVVGHFNADLRNFETVVSSRPVILLARGLYYVLPNLAPLDVKTQVVHALPVPADYLLWNTAYALVYVTMLLVGATLIFMRRDFK